MTIVNRDPDEQRSCQKKAELGVIKEPLLSNPVTLRS